MEITLTPDSELMMLNLCKDAVNWNGTPLLDVLTDKQKGNLTDLKVKGLLTTQSDPLETDSKGIPFVWVYFTDVGKEYSKAQYGIEI